jgi:hypothetical protein
MMEGNVNVVEFGSVTITLTFTEFERLKNILWFIEAYGGQFGHLTADDCNLASKLLTEIRNARK